MEQQMIFSVSEANNFIKALLDRVPQLQEIFVRGEISNYKLYPSGHHYFTLKDAEGAMRCVLFKGNALRLRFFKPDRGASAKIEAGQTAVAVSTDRHEEKAAIPAAEEQPVQEKEAIRMEKTLKIEGMMCAHCQKHVHDALAKMDGVTDVTVDLEGGKADVKATHDISEADFRKVIEEAGYELVG